MAAPPSTALQRALILVSVILATTLYATTLTIANVALPQMQGDLSASIDQIAWVLTFNIVATAIATPPTGWPRGSAANACCSGPCSGSRSARCCAASRRRCRS